MRYNERSVTYCKGIHCKPRTQHYVRASMRPGVRALVGALRHSQIFHSVAIRSDKRNLQDNYNFTENISNKFLHTARHRYHSSEF